MLVDRGSELTDVSIVRRMPNIQTLSLRQVFADMLCKSCEIDNMLQVARCNKLQQQTKLFCEDIIIMGKSASW